MATVDLGKISFTQKGTWSSSTAYVAKDVVQFTDDSETSSYVAVASSTNQAPATNGTVNSSYWALFAKGASIASNYQSSAWASGTAYQKGSVVQYTDTGIVSTYLAVADSTGETPSTSGSINSSYWAYLAKGTASAGTAWDSTPKTANFTAVAGNGYWLDSSGGAFTITLPAGSNGSTIEFSDIGGSSNTNNITVTPDGSEKIDGVAGSRLIGVNRQGIRLVYSTAANGWTSPTGNYNETTPWFVAPYNMQYVAVAGGGAGGDSNSGGGGAGGMLEASGVQVNGGETLTITVGAGGASVDNAVGNDGSNSVISGAGIVAVTCIGGGGGNGRDGGSGGGAKYSSSTGGNGTSGQGNNGGGANTSSPQFGAGGGGGKGAVGGTGNSNAGGAGGAGQATSITGSSVTLAGGGGGSVDQSNSAAGAGGSGGGGNGTKDSNTGTDGTANTGGGGGGSHNPTTGSGAGGSGVVYIRVPTANYTGTTTGSPTVTTTGSDTVMKFTANGTYST